jgi:hypothetical protein
VTYQSSAQDNTGQTILGTIRCYGTPIFEVARSQVAALT